MLDRTRAIALHAVKYGDTSLVATLFTYTHGVQSYMVQGARSTKAKLNRAAFFQPGTLLDLVVYLQPQKNLQRIGDLQTAYIYSSIQESVQKNSIVLFSVEVLMRLLPEHAPLASLFDFTYDYFVHLDRMKVKEVANFPLYFIIQCSSLLGYELKGNYTSETPYLDLNEGAYTEQASVATHISVEDGQALNVLLSIQGYEQLAKIEMSSGRRMRLIEWYIQFLQQHTQHMGNIRSLAVLQTVLH